MKVKSSMWVVIFLIIMVVVVVLREDWLPEGFPVMAKQTSQVAEDPKVAAAISRANVAKLIAYTFYNQDEIEALERKIELEDTLPSFWYDKYINAAITLGHMEGTDNKFYPGELMTYKQVVDVLGSISKNKYSIKVRAKEDVRDQKIAMENFMAAYLQLLDKLNEKTPGKDPYHLEEKNIIILASPATDESLGPWRAATDQGEYGFEGLSIDPYIDQQIKVIVKNNEILGIIDVISKNPTLESVYITRIEEGVVDVLVGGITKKYQSSLVDESYIDLLADLHFEDGLIVGVDVKEEEYKDRVLRVTDSTIETEKGGLIPISQDLKIYDTTGQGVSWSKLNNIVVGTPDIEYAMDKGKINAITIKKKPSLKHIRLLITTTGFEGRTHDQVKVKSSQPFLVDFYGEKRTYKAGEEMDIKQWAKKMTREKPRIKITSLSESKDEPMLLVETIKRRDKEPVYWGSLEVSREEEGGYTLINEVSMEDYVAAVIPSEMPTSYGLEACKVQAIVARSYAYVHALNNKFGQYGANLDDSTNSQVYNNIPADEISLLAAKETAGQVLQYNGQVISSNCFSTSPGYTANYGEVWANPDGTFPANTPVYLVSKEQYAGKKMAVDMKDEKDAYNFFKNPSKKDDFYDSGSPWFRWQVTMSAKEISASVNAGIKKRYGVNPALVKTLGKDRVFRSKDITEIGQVEKIQIQKRGEGGNVMEMIFYGADDTIKVSTEYNIRSFLSPMQRLEGQDPIIIKRQDATEIKNYEMLPSAFFAMDANYDKNEKLQSVTLYGGGFGHGVGMSQDGVKGMVEKDYSYTEILGHYFPETKVGSSL